MRRPRPPECELHDKQNNRLRRERPASSMSLSDAHLQTSPVRLRPRAPIVQRQQPSAKRGRHLPRNRVKTFDDRRLPTPAHQSVVDYSGDYAAKRTVMVLICPSPFRPIPPAPSPSYAPVIHRPPAAGVSPHLPADAVPETPVPKQYFRSNECRSARPPCRADTVQHPTSVFPRSVKASSNQPPRICYRQQNGRSPASVPFNAGDRGGEKSPTALAPAAYPVAQRFLHTARKRIP